MTERTTLEPIGEYAEIMEEMEEALSDPSRQKDDRSGEDPQGMRLSQKSKITMGGQEVRQRTQAWRTDDGREAWLPTATLPYHLAKRRPNGQRAFVLRKPDVAQRTPLNLSCATCQRAQGLSRSFYDESQYEDHQEILHPREWAREQRERDRTQRERELVDRREELAIMRTLVERGVISAETAVEAEAVINEEAVINAFVCADCGKGFSRKVALIGHQRTHRKSA